MEKKKGTLPAFLLKTKQQLAFPLFTHLTAVIASWAHTQRIISGLLRGGCAKEDNGNESNSSNFDTHHRQQSHCPLTSIRKKLGSFASAFESHTIKNAPFFTTPFQKHVVEDVPAD